MAVRRYVLSIEGFKRRMQGSEELCERRLVIAQRFVTDPKMRRVWRTLERCGKADDSAIFKFIQCACGTDIHSRSVDDRAKTIEFASAVASACRDLIKTRRVGDEPSLSLAFELVAGFFEKEARREERTDPRFLVKNRIKDDQARAYVRMLADLTRRIFGATLYRTVATVATVALGRPIGWQQVRNWCSTKPGTDRN
jgi:hypothetical protein